MKKTIEVALLAVLAGVLGFYAYQRIGIRMGGTPSTLQSPFASEEHWMLDTILRDVSEGAAYARGVPMDEVRVAYDINPAGPLELPSVRVEIILGDDASTELSLDLERSFWTPENYSSLASELMDDSSRQPSHDGDAETGGVLETLLEPTPSSLMAESDRIAARLRADIRNPLPHEEAALLLGVFGLREAAYGFNDKRFVLLRMTSHLAIAYALRGRTSLSVPGRTGEATLLALSGRQEELFDRLDDPTIPDSWKSVLLMYSTEDWRHSSTSDSFLVQLMRFRAMVASLGASTALERMDDVVGRDRPDWGRILAWLASGDVASRSFLEEQLGQELAEAEEVSLVHFGKSLAPNELSDALNRHPGGMIGDEGPQALDWGMWAQFYQRHLCGAILARNRSLRQALGLTDAAESFGSRTELVFSSLDLHPIVQVHRTRNVGGRVEDTLGMDGAIAFTREHPELVNPTTWLYLTDTAAHMMRKRGMPDAAAWFSRRVLVTGALDGTSHRLEVFERVLDVPRILDAMSEVAPRHPFVLHEVLERVDRDESAFDTLSSLLGERLEFDLHALRDLREVAKEEEDRLDVLGRMCGIDANECADLAWEYVYLQRESDAVQAFENFIENASSAVHVCNNANWLVNYYFDNGRRREAQALADRVADVFCSWGIRTKAYLLERMGQPVSAEQLYRADSDRYEYDGPVAPSLLGFYYRRARVEGDADYETTLQQMLTKVFPDGLEPLSDDSRGMAPVDGVLIDGDSKVTERTGLRGGDVIVGLDGWRVQTLEQYDTVLAFRARTSNAQDMRLRVWRQTAYFDHEVETLSRRFYVRMRTNGTPGPSFQWR